MFAPHELPLDEELIRGNVAAASLKHRETHPRDAERIFLIRGNVAAASLKRD